MLTLLLAMSAPVLAGAPLEISVPSGIEAVSLRCGSEVERAEVRGGVAAFSRAPLPTGCTVHLEQEVGRVDLQGAWTCDQGGCVQAEVAHRPVYDAPGRVNVILDGETHPMAELACPGGFRARANFEEHVAVFDGVPGEECTLHFKGGPPARYRPIQVGSWQCRVMGSAAACGRR